MTKAFAHLTLAVLHHKMKYYIEDDPELSDHGYDQLEREYIKQAKELNVEPVASDMVGYSVSAASVILKELRSGV